MGVRFLFILVSLLVLKGHCSSEILADQDELSKRAIQKPGAVFRRLKLTFLRFGSRSPSRPQPGSSKLDIVFVLDRSGSIGPTNFAIEKQFVTDLIEFFPVFPANTRVAIVSYSAKVKLEFNFKKYPNRECTRKGIQNIRYSGGFTATGVALEYVRTSLLFNSAAGARSNAKKIIYVLTDGKSNVGVAPFSPATQLKRRGITIFAMGITPSIRRSELLSIASGPSYVFHLQNYAALNQVVRLLQGDISKKCRSGQIVYDECQRRCKCVGGKLVQCCRMRKEFTDMSNSERVRYINTVKTASTHPTYKARYEQLLTLHETIFFSNIHLLDFFLPWHRWYILQYENLLQEIDCRVTVPYWDWSLVAANPLSSDVWNPGPQGFGGNGSGSPTCVRTGPFRAGVWSVIPSAGGGCLTRIFEGRAPDAVAVRELIVQHSAAQFVSFEQLLRGEFHDLVHCVIGGTMCTTDSASAPEFFLHHGFVDKIWWDWQKQSNAHMFNRYFLTQIAQMPSTVYRSRDFLDLQNQPGCVCADYVAPTSSTYKSIQGLSIAQLQDIPRLPLPRLSSKAVRLFRRSSAELQRLARLRKTLSPRRTLKKSALSGKDGVRGFKATDVKGLGRRRRFV